MELTSFHTIEDFYNRAAPFLLEREGEHNLILGLCAVLMRNPPRIEQQPYLATVEDRGRVVAAALMTPPNNLVLSYMKDAEAITLIASHVYSRYETLHGVVSSTPFSEQFAAEWQRLTGRPYRYRL